MRLCPLCCKRKALGPEAEAVTRSKRAGASQSRDQLWAKSQGEGRGLQKSWIGGWTESQMECLTMISQCFMNSSGFLDRISVLE